MEREELIIAYCTTNTMLDDYFTNTLQRALFHKFRDIVMGKSSLFTLIENTFLYTITERVGKQIPPKEIPLGTVDPLK